MQPAGSISKTFTDVHPKDQEGVIWRVSLSMAERSNTPTTSRSKHVLSSFTKPTRFLELSDHT